MSEHTTHIPEIRPLQRSRSDRMLAGVSGGLARYFEIHPAIFRVGFVVLTLLGGAGILIYLAAWLVIPDEGKDDSIATAALRNRRDRPWPLIGVGLPRRRGRDPALARDAVARRRLLVALPPRRPPDPLAHAPARRRGRRPGRAHGCEGTRRPGLASRARVLQVARDRARDARHADRARRRDLHGDLRRRPRERHRRAHLRRHERRAVEGRLRGRGRLAEPLPEPARAARGRDARRTPASTSAT